MQASVRLLDAGKMWISHAGMFHKTCATGLRAMCRFCWRAKIRWGAPKAAYRQACLYACNHRSFLDPPLVGMWVHEATSYFARRSLWKIPIIKQVLNNVGGVPVDRAAPGMASIRDAVAMLREGRNLIIFPEGTRTKTGRLGRFRDGPAMISRRAGVPVVPVYVHNSERGWKRGAPLPSVDAPGIEVRFGRPLLPPSELSGREQDRWMTEALQRWMEAQENDLRGGA